MPSRCADSNASFSHEARKTAAQCATGGIEALRSVRIRTEFPVAEFYEDITFPDEGDVSA